jgi:diacylglycerol kinase (ATP)
MKRARLIYNPTAGRESVRRHLAEILETMEAAGYETSTHATSGKGDATREAERVVHHGYDLVIAAGGDGTVYEVINGIAGKEVRPTLGILPMGTSNDLANALGIPKNIHKALEILARGNTREIDVGKMNDRYFINIAAGGNLTELSYEVPSKMKTFLGQLAYYVKGVEKLPGIHPYSITVEANGEVWNEEVMLFLVANSTRVGGFDKLAPLADLSDGLFDVLLLKKANIVDLMRIMPMVLNGNHVKDPKMIYFQTDRLTIRTMEEVKVNLDGELGGMTPCEFQVLKKHLKVIANIQDETDR